MVEIPSLDSREAPRARRWDALILGSGIPALVAAVRIGKTGQRVLVVEEEARAKLPPALREPFFLAGFRDGGVLDGCLRALAVPMIERRRLAPERLAYQIAADPHRLDIGQPLVTAEELVTWGLAKPDDAQSLVRHLIEASEVELGLLLEAPFARIGRRSAGSRSASGLGHHKRGLPGDAARATGALADVLAAQIRSLSNLGQTTPSPEAQARLLGLGLAGGTGFADAPPWLNDILRKRVTALYGDFRTLSGDFELVSVSGQPGIRVLRTGEIWLGRSLVLAAPLSSLRDAVHHEPTRPAPSVLDRQVTRAYRAAFLFRIPTTILPEGMSARVILSDLQNDADPSTRTGGEGDPPTVTITAFPSQTKPNWIDLVARAIVPEADPIRLPDQLTRLGDSIGRRLEALMPFCGDHLHRIEFAAPQWDAEDGWLEDPPPGSGWPAEIDLRLSSRPPIFHLDRATVAGLGLEGDLLLGWRGGDAIARELA